MEPKLRNDNSSQFFPVFLGITALILSVMFYGVMSVGMYVDGGQDKEVLGVNTVLHTATIKVKDGSVTKTYQGITFEEGLSAYDFLREAMKQSSFDFDADVYDFGYYIHTINGRRSLNNEYWKFVLNGDDSKVRMEEHEVKNNDVIEFVLDRF